MLTYSVKLLVSLWGTLSVALLLFTLIVAGINIYRTARSFWLMVVLSWAVAYILCGVLFFYFRVDLILTLMISSLAAYILMGDVLLGRKRVTERPIEETKNTEQ